MALIAVVVAIAVGLTTPAPAGAFVWPGESLVLNPGKTDLTGPAKTILTKPTFLPANVGEAGIAGGVSEASGAARVFQAAKILPALGAVTAFGVGTQIGSEICGVLGIAGCWYHGSEEADPVDEVTGSWFFHEDNARPEKSYVWGWSLAQKLDYPPNPACVSGPPNAPGFTHVITEFSLQSCNVWIDPEDHGKGQTVESAWTLRPMRYSMENRVLEYHATDDPSISNYSYTAPSDWSEKLAEELKEAPEGSAAAYVGQKIASEIEGSGVASPYGVVAIPNCSGEAWIGCKEDLEEFELVPERAELTWEEAHLDLGADSVVETQPAPGTKVKTGTKVTVTTNPDEAGMPLVVPDLADGETYDDYVSKMAPGLKPNRKDLGEFFTDPSVGPNGVVAVQPEPGTRLNPSSEHDVDVKTNPATAPQAAPGWSPPGLPSINLGPIAGLSSPCTVFPFGLLCWLGEGLAQFNTAGECPHTSVPVNADTDFDLTLCGDTSEQLMSYIRPLLLFAWIIGCAFLFARATKAIGGGD